MHHREFLGKALIEAKKNQNEGQIPIGCVIVNQKGVILASDKNQSNKLHDRTAHADMLAIRSAIKHYDEESAVVVINPLLTNSQIIQPIE